MNRVNKKRQNLLDIEQRITEEKPEEVKIHEPAIVKENIYFQPSTPEDPPVMTPKKKKEKKSILHKIYSFRNASTSSPVLTRKPSSMRTPSFIPMPETRMVHPPTYEDSIVPTDQKH